MSHRDISFVKSFVRIVGYLLIGAMYTMQLNHWAAAWYGGWGSLVLSELIGIYEELGEV